MGVSARAEPRRILPGGHAAQARLVRAVDLVREDVEQHLRVRVRLQVPLVRQLALRLQRRAQLLRVRQVAVVDLRRELREPPRGRLYALTALAAPDRCPEAS